jgi:hypothetical protein
MDIENVVNIHNGDFLTQKRTKLCHLQENGLELEITILSDTSQSHEDKYGIFSHICNLGK